MTYAGVNKAPPFQTRGEKSGLTEMRAPEREVFYLVGTPRGKIQ